MGPLPAIIWVYHSRIVREEMSVSRGPMRKLAVMNSPLALYMKFSPKTTSLWLRKRASWVKLPNSVLRISAPILYAARMPSPRAEPHMEPTR